VIRTGFLKTLLTSLGIGSILTVTSLNAARIEQPSGIFYYQPAASVFGCEAVWVNPASLARYRASGFQFMFDYYDGSYGNNYGSVLNRYGLAVAYRKIDNPEGIDYREYVFGAGTGFRNEIFVGGSYGYYKEAPDNLNRKHFWNIGLIEQRGGPLTWGMVFSNLNRSKIDGERSDIEMRYSVAYRPNKKRFTLAADMFLSTGTRFSNADYVFHLEVIPRTGFYLNGFIDTDNNFQIGFRTNLLRYFTGSKSDYDEDGNHLGTTTFIGGTSLRQQSVIPYRNRRLHLGLAGRVNENPPQPVWGRKPIPFTSLLMNIYRAAEDPSINEMTLTLNGIKMGFGQSQELRDALQYFKSKGKLINCHLTNPGNLSYYLAIIADRIFIPPVCQFNLVGLRAELTFYAGTMEKLGIKADLVRIGDYKTAPEAYTREASSDENREQVNRLLDNLFDQFVEAISSGRNISADSVKKIIDNGPYTSAEALEYGLVDGLSYRDDLSHKYLSKMPEVSFKRYLTDTLVNDNWPRKPVLALVVADGDISNSNYSNLFKQNKKVTPAVMQNAFGKAISNRDVRGIVFRINSPGGLALAAEDIYHTARKASEKKPMVVSMSNVSASGGYQLAMSGESLFASPGSITGSIGIYGGKVDLSDLYSKISLGKELYTRGRFSGMMSSIRPFTDEEREKYYSHLKAFYGYFLELVADNRNLYVDSVDALARGRVWTGKEAREIGLIDRLGGLKQSFDYMAEKLELDDYSVEIYPLKRPWFVLPGGSYLKAITSIFTGEKDPVADVTESLDFTEEGGILTRMPYDIEIE